MEKMRIGPTTLRSDVPVATTRPLGTDNKTENKNFKYFCFIILVILMMVLHVLKLLPGVMLAVTVDPQYLCLFNFT